MARLKRHISIQSSDSAIAEAESFPAGPMPQKEATRWARKHPKVLAALQQVHEYLRSCGIDNPADPRWIFYNHSVTSDPEYQRLSSAHTQLFSRVRRELMAD